MSEDVAFWNSQNSSLGRALDADDLLHPAKNALSSADSTTETQYFAFCKPEEKIHAYGYLWHHPNLRIVTGGLMVWKGINATALSADLCDIRHYMSDKALALDLHKYCLDNGYGVEVIEPLKRHRMSYSDPARRNSVDLRYEALAPPVMFGDGNHFEQPMKVQGELILRGERYSIDCYTVRDRSWGKPRPEDNQSAPPYSWMSGVFNEQFSFNCGLMDHVGSSEAGNAFELPESKALSGGWLIKDGQVGRLTAARKRIERGKVLRIPTRIVLEMTDELDRTLEIKGEIVSSCPWTPWTNIHMTISLFRWECEGQVAFGDFQEAMWNDYCRETYSDVALTR